MALASPVRGVRRKVGEQMPAGALYQVLKRTVGPEIAPKPIDLSYLDIIREQDPQDLADPGFLEHLLPRLGLNDDGLHQLPTALHRHTGYGLLHWQLPNQFSKYLVGLTSYRIERYLEIGVRHGGTFVATIEFLSKFQVIKAALGVDLALHPSLFRYRQSHPGVAFKQANTQSLAFRRFIRSQEKFDLALIDGDHTEGGCRRDFETVRDKARIVVFHDIVSDSCPGVRKVWRDVKDTYGDRYTFFEYSDQYEEFANRGGALFGIGVAVSEEAVKRSSAGLSAG